MARSFSDQKVKILTKKKIENGKRFLLFIEIKHFKGPTPQWHKKKNAYV